MALVEDEVDDGEDGDQSVRELGLVRDRVRDAGVTDLALRPREPLLHRRLGDEERLRHLRGAQTADDPQRERDLGGSRQRWVAGRAQQPQPFVRDPVGLRTRIVGVGHDQERSAATLRVTSA